MLIIASLGMCYSSSSLCDSLSAHSLCSSFPPQEGKALNRVLTKTLLCLLCVDAVAAEDQRGAGFLWEMTAARLREQGCCLRGAANIPVSSHGNTGAASPVPPVIPALPGVLPAGMGLRKQGAGQSPCQPCPDLPRAGPSWGPNLRKGQAHHRHFWKQPGIKKRSIPDPLVLLDASEIRKTGQKLIFAQYIQVKSSKS